VKGKPLHSDDVRPAPAGEPGLRKAAVLVIDDSPVHRAELCRALGSSSEIGEIVAVEDGLAGLKALLTRSFDAVICDLEMPGFDGEKLLAVREQKADLADAPMLFVSANRDPARKARLLERGASDTLEKPFHDAELLARLGVHLRLRELRRELSEKNAQLEQLSTTDALTGLRNRRYAESFLAREFERSRRHGDPLAVVLADLDHFKKVNDAHGHAIGDAALRHVASLLENSVRKTDVCARWGGEEFVIGLVQPEVDGVCEFAERQRAAVEAAPLELPDGRRLALTVSFGVAMYTPADNKVADLVDAADRALYRAKRAGRNRVERFTR
jgi:diguanylate cyclase (GGDEF)-like protein